WQECWRPVGIGRNGTFVPKALARSINVVRATNVALLLFLQDAYVADPTKMVARLVGNAQNQRKCRKNNRIAIQPSGIGRPPARGSKAGVGPMGMGRPRTFD